MKYTLDSIIRKTGTALRKSTFAAGLAASLFFGCSNFDLGALQGGKEGEAESERDAMVERYDGGMNYDGETKKNGCTKQPFFLDSDNDRFGDAAYSLKSCKQEQGYVANSDDCDDTNETVYPGAREICDGLDNNCDRIVDNNLTSPSRACSVGVGECRRSGLEYRVCEGAAGWGNFGDCDAVPGIPEAEICDGLDNNCDEVVDNCVGRVSAGLDYTCAVVDDGAVRCWGRNDYGQLGDGTTTSRPTPALVSGLTNVAHIELGARHSCALVDSGHVYCWGRNNAGQLGDGTRTDSYTPTPVPGLESVMLLALGRDHTCALLADNTVQCWGSNWFGQLGDGEGGAERRNLTPTPVYGLTNVRWIASGAIHTCAVLDDRTARCWGLNSYGQLGDGTTTNRLTPTPVSGLRDVDKIALNDHTCATLSDFTLRCWGRNGYGQLGDGTTTERHTPITVPGLNIVDQIGLSTHTCAYLYSETAQCWGLNSNGQLGDGTTTNRLSPGEPVPELDDITELAVGNNHTCAVLGAVFNDGTLVCWGGNNYGQLGDGTTEDRHTPTPVEW